MTKVTYLLGAGASCQALPLAKDIKTSSGEIIGLARSMITQAKELKELLETGEIKFANSIQFIENTIVRLSELPESASEFDSIDDYAKHLYIQGSNELEELKSILSRYFLIEQLYNRKFDKRYISFLNKILRTRMFPSNIKVLTWNYDFQFEIAAGKFQKEDFSSNGFANRRTLPLINYYPPIGHNSLNDDYQLVHLNGIAGHSLSKKHFINNLIYYDLNEEVETIFNWISTQQRLNHCMNFAWEANDINVNALNIAKKTITGTDILVIIGYSFPDFNYEADFRLFEVLTENLNLQIYYQDPIQDGKFMTEKFSMSKSISEKIVWKKNINHFYIPNELLRNT
ncbi:MAG: hypothetical protein K8R68_07510 [Bacteroidales bacterium]|nr:hypothetical protein [Bacteroidales bacterium]